jgi:hypothetical protein
MIRFAEESDLKKHTQQSTQLSIQNVDTESDTTS